MKLDLLLQELAARGVIVTANGDKLHIEAPIGALTAELRSALAENKAAILACLRSEGGRIDPESTTYRIPLSLDKPPSVWLIERGLRIVGGTPNGPNGEPTLFVTDMA